MLQIYFGNDVVKIRTTALLAVEQFVSSGYQLQRIDPSEINQSRIIDMLGAVSLFGEKTVFLLDTPSDDADAYVLVTGVIEEMIKSENIFIVIESTLTALAKKKWQAADVKEEFTAKAVAYFDTFKMAEALTLRDKKTLWMLFAQAKRENLSAEEIAGVLWWQLKTMRLAAVTKSAEEAGMKSYPYDKAKKALRNFKAGEIEKLSRDLLQVYHDGHGGIKDIDLGLEEWVLAI